MQTQLQCGIKMYRRHFKHILLPGEKQVRFQRGGNKAEFIMEFTNGMEYIFSLCINSQRWPRLDSGIL